MVIIFFLYSTGLTRRLTDTTTATVAKSYAPNYVAPALKFNTLL